MAKRLILLVLIFVNLIIVSASAGPEISIIPEEITAVPGEEFTVFVQLNPADKEVYGYQYSLYFDSELLEVVNQRSGEFLSKYGSAITVNNKFDNKKGNLSYGETLLGEKNGVEEIGVTSSIIFRVKESSSPGTENILEIGDVLLSDPDAHIIDEITVKNGLLKVEKTSGVLQEGSSSEISDSEISNIMDPHLLSLIESPENEESYIPIIVTVESDQFSTFVDLIDSYEYGISNVHEMPEINALSAEAWPSIILEISEKIYVDSVILGIAGISEGSDSTYSEQTNLNSKVLPKKTMNGSDPTNPNTSAADVESDGKKSPGYGIIISLTLLFYSYITQKKK